MWYNYKEKVAKKDEMTKGQLLLPEGAMELPYRGCCQVEGKCQTYSRIGPLTLVPLDQEPSL